MNIFAKVRPFLLFAMAINLYACVSTVDFSDGRKIGHPELPSVQIFFDKQGDVYPIEWITSDEQLIDNSYHSLMCQFDKGLCGITDSTIRSDADRASHYLSWRKIQAVENNRVANEVLAALDGTANKSIVLLIHGFRVPNASETYADAKMVLLNNHDISESPVFLEVHWDGRQSRALPFSALKAWPPAQWTAPAVGFRLRSLLNALHDKLDENGTEADLFIMTHSTGAVVAGALFGDPSGALPCLKNPSAADKCGPTYMEFYNSMGSDEGSNMVPQWSNMNLVLLAPATPASTFAMSGNQDIGFLGDRNTNIVISHSKNDSALNKYIKFPGLLGDSGLGVRLNDSKIIKAELEGVSPKRANVIVMEMSENLGKKHDAYDYMRDKEFSKALKLLWQTNP